MNLHDDAGSQRPQLQVLGRRLQGGAAAATFTPGANSGVGSPVVAATSAAAAADEAPDRAQKDRVQDQVDVVAHEFVATR